MTVYVVGKYVQETERGAVWELQGVFDDKVLAEAACLTDCHFVGEVNMNEMLPEESVRWPVVYPKEVSV